MLVTLSHWPCPTLPHSAYQGHFLLQKIMTGVQILASDNISTATCIKPKNDNSTPLKIPAQNQARCLSIQIVVESVNQWLELKLHS